MPKTAHRLKEVSGSWTVADWSPDDRRVAAVEYVSINESYVHLIDVATGEVETVTPRRSAGEPTVSYADVLWSKDGKSLYWTTDRDSDFRRLARFDLDTRKTTVLTAMIPWDIEAFDLADNGRTIVVVANEDGFSKVYILDAQGGGPVTLAMPAGVIGGLEFRKGSTEFAFTLSSAHSPADVYSYGIEFGRPRRAGRSARRAASTPRSSPSPSWSASRASTADRSRRSSSGRGRSSPGRGRC